MNLQELTKTLNATESQVSITLGDRAPESIRADELNDIGARIHGGKLAVARPAKKRGQLAGRDIAPIAMPAPEAPAPVTATIDEAEFQAQTQALVRALNPELRAIAQVQLSQEVSAQISAGFAAQGITPQSIVAAAIPRSNLVIDIDAMMRAAADRIDTNAMIAEAIG